MAWEKNTRGKPRYVVKERIGGKVVSRPFRTEEDAIAYKEIRDAKRKAVLKELEKETKLESALVELERLSNQIIEQTLVCRGVIRRAGVWQFVDRLNKPLTQEEKLYIRRIKAKAVPFVLPPNWPNLETDSCQKEYESQNHPHSSTPCSMLATES